MKLFIVFLFSLCLFTGCVGSTTNFTNRSISYIFTESQEGENSVSHQGKPGAATIQADKVTETKANVADGDLTDNATSSQQQK